MSDSDKLVSSRLLQMEDWLELSSVERESSSSTSSLIHLIVGSGRPVAQHVRFVSVVTRLDCEGGW